MSFSHLKEARLVEYLENLIKEQEDKKRDEQRTKYKK